MINREWGREGGPVRREELEVLVTRESEESFVLPEAWRRALHPRRGGVRRPPGEADRATVARLEARLAGDEDWIEEFLAAPGSDARLVAAARAHLDGSAPSPLGAAAVAAMTPAPPATTAAWADVWSAAHGLPFAARAVVELFGIEARYLQCGADRSDPALAVLGSAPVPCLTEQRRPPADRVRALLAVAGDETYRAAVEALADAREDERRRIVVAYLVPTETGWVDECCGEPGPLAGRDPFLRSMLLCSLSTPEQLLRLGGTAGIAWPPSTIATVAEGLGPAAAPLLAEVLDRPHASAAHRRTAAAALAELPGDAAFRTLLSRPGDKHVRPSLLKAMTRRPVCALRVLAACAHEGGRDADAARELLAGHIAAHQELVTAALPLLDEPAAAVVRSLRHRPGRVPDAPAGELPALLTTPPWQDRAAARPGGRVVPGLRVPAAPAVRWLPGEREDWAATRSPYLRHHAADGHDMDVDVEALRRYGLEDLSSAQLFLRGPVELLRPLLAAWAPDDYWEGEKTLRPVAARYGTDALPVLTRAAVRHPATMAGLLLPFRDAGTARLMADWAVRLRTAGGPARAWFARHGVAAVPLLVPDAVGAPGSARRLAEHALRLIAAAHGDEAVRDAAADAYGEEAAEVVAAALGADPLLTALPDRMPGLPEWADPSVLPQLLLRTGGHALPAGSVRHALTMLAISRPGEVYPGVPVLLDLCDPGSLAEFGWALFERWRSAGMPARESWALHALGLLGDDGTVRRLAPVLRSWPGEGAHHRAVEGLDVLAAIGTGEALAQLHGIAQRVRFKALRARAQEKVTELTALAQGAPPGALTGPAETPAR